MPKSSYLNNLKFYPNILRKNLNIRPWRTGSNIGLISANQTNNLTKNEILTCLEKLQKKGFTEATTTAIPALDIQIFLDAGFDIRENLFLLSKLLTPRDIKVSDTQPSKPWNVNQILEVDHLCFDNFWKFDSRSFFLAQKATQERRTRVVKIDRTIVAYAITGKAGATGYLQRLAVNPNNSNIGIGKELIKDSLNWLATNKTDIAMVNTQENNIKAIHVYESLGFKKEKNGLAVLKWSI